MTHRWTSVELFAATSNSGERMYQGEVEDSVGLELLKYYESVGAVAEPKFNFRESKIK